MLAVKQKIFAFVFALLCLFSSAQFVLCQHFCCNKLVKVCSIELEESCCSSEKSCHSNESDGNDDCCDDKDIVVESEQFIAQEKIDIPTEQIVKSTTYFGFASQNISVLKAVDFYSRPPPDSSSLESIHCVFRI